MNTVQKADSLLWQERLPWKNTDAARIKCVDGGAKGCDTFPKNNSLDMEECEV